MKKIKITHLLLGLFASVGTLCASVVPQNVAQGVATNFYGRTFNTPVLSTTLTYTEKDNTGVVSYYVFNINANKGFVIVSAENAGRPIIGYSNVGKYVVPTPKNNMDFWMKKRNTEIGKMRALQLTATNDITNEWNAYINNTSIPQSSSLSNPGAPSTQSNPFPSSTNYLVKSTWDQYNENSTTICAYNCLCPSGSVTGCVATTMAQIMRYWQYPAKGTGSSNYCDCTSGGYTNNYGTLSANYGTTNYHYTNMPLTNPTSESDIDTLMYDAGVSVQMDYDPNGSGAYVITADDPSACAQISYVNYFGYSPTILHGLDALSNATTWQDTLETELNHSRPIQYVGQDPTQGGHTWVCDGFNSSNDFHMNWGWSGYDDGWFALNNLAPANTGINFSEGIEALIGIMPPTVASTAPTSSYTASSSPVCAGSSITFTSTSTGSPTSYSWIFQSGSPATSTTSSQAVTYATAGTYTVSLTATNSAGSNTTTSSIVVNPTPTVTATASVSTVCSGTSSTLTGAGGTTYSWNTGSTTNPLTVTPTATTTYTVTGTNSSGCKNTSTVKVTVNAKPTITVNSPSICSGGASAVLTGTGGSTYSWNTGSTTNPLTVTPTVTTTYTVTGTNTNGCTNTAKATVTVGTQPTITATASISTVCSGTSSTLTGAGGSTYSWNTGSTSNPLTVSPTTTTTYTVTGTNGSGCSGTTTVTVTVNANPAMPTVTQTGSVLTANPPASSYQWYLNGTIINGATSQTYTATTNGHYTVEESNSNGCTSTSLTDTVTNTGIAENSFQNSFNVYPNPNDGQFELNFSVSNMDNYTIEIHNAIGQLVYQEYLSNYTGTYAKQISLQNFGKGIYMLSLTNSHNQGVKKLIVF